MVGKGTVRTGAGRTSKAEMLACDAAVLSVLQRALGDAAPICMGCVERFAGLDGGVYVSLPYAKLGVELGVSAFRVRSALRRLEGAGLIDAVERHDDCGGQLANGFRLTSEGWRAVRAMKAAAVSALGDVYNDARSCPRHMEVL